MEIISFINTQTTIKPLSRFFGFDRGMPIDRYYIEKFLDGNKEFIKGNILEVGENTYSKKFGGGGSILKYVDDGTDAIIGDLTKLKTLPENLFDCFICTQTLNFIYDIRQAIKGIYHLLKPNGTVLVTVSGLAQVSRYDMDRWGDYWRFTDNSIKRLFEEEFKKENISVKIYGNCFAAISFLEGVAVEDICDKKLLDDVDEDYQITLGIVAKKTD